MNEQTITKKDISCTFTVSKKDLEKAKLETELQKVADKTGAIFQNSFVKTINKKIKQDYLSMRRSLKGFLNVTK